MLTWSMILTFLFSAVGLVDVQPVVLDAASVEANVNEKTILDSDTINDSKRWARINDDVMGGVSQSQLHFTDNGTAVFAGILSLKNNGGFASVRTYPDKYDLGGYEGLAIRIKGDGQRYKLRVRTDDRWDGVAYSADFETTPGEWVAVHLRFDDFAPTFRDRQVPNAPKLTGDMVHQIGFMIADKQAGSFTLEIDSVKAYRT